ncbi:Sulfate permease CysP [subsurface metagenome]
MLSILLVPFMVAIFLAINMGGSGTSPSFSAAYGSDIIRKDLIPSLFGIFVFLGAIIAGKKVILTIGRGILPAEAMNFTLTTIILLSISLSLLIANLLGVPQSTSQSTVFALVAPAIYYNILKTNKLLFQIVPTWFILPICSFIITLFIGKFIYL